MISRGQFVKLWVFVSLLFNCYRHWKEEDPIVSPKYTTITTYSDFTCYDLRSEQVPGEYIDLDTGKEMSLERSKQMLHNICLYFNDSTLERSNQSLTSLKDPWNSICCHKTSIDLDTWETFSDTQYKTLQIVRWYNLALQRVLVTILFPCILVLFKFDMLLLYPEFGLTNILQLCIVVSFIYSTANFGV